jgi:hypothetical protein
VTIPMILGRLRCQLASPRHPGCCPSHGTRDQVMPGRCAQRRGALTPEPVSSATRG